jgi:hypothetical protein
MSLIICLEYQLHLLSHMFLGLYNVTLYIFRETFAGDVISRSVVCTVVL